MYWVYINRTRKRACWHREACGYVLMRGGTAERADQEWVPCETPAKAQRVLSERTVGFKRSNVTACSRCRPN